MDLTIKLTDIEMGEPKKIKTIINEALEQMVQNQTVKDGVENQIRVKGGIISRNKGIVKLVRRG